MLFTVLQYDLCCSLYWRMNFVLFTVLEMLSREMALVLEMLSS